MVFHGYAYCRKGSSLKFPLIPYQAALDYLNATNAPFPQAKKFTRQANEKDLNKHEPVSIDRGEAVLTVKGTMDDGCLNLISK